MHYLLITTKGTNFGDDAVCQGIKNIVLSVDRNASFVLINKENQSEWSKPIPFDKAIWCGMPLFWSYGGDTTSTISWWKFLIGWVSQIKNNFIILGAGSFCPWKNEIDTLQNREQLIKSVEMLKNRSYKISVRDSVANKITKQNFEILVCPSIAALENIKSTNSPIKIVNIMPDGSHYKVFNSKEAECWKGKKYLLADFARDNNYTFVAHNKEEHCEAIKLGFHKIILPKSLSEFLSTYKRCRYYIGNRIHGSLLAKAAGAKIINIGYDSRQECVNLVNGKTYFPSEVTINILNDFETSPQNNIGCLTIIQRYKTIIREFQNV